MNSALTVRHKVSIAGRVIDNATLQPIPRARVTIVEMPALVKRSFELRAKYSQMRDDSTSIDPVIALSRIDGLFWFVDLPEGEYRLRADIPVLGRRSGTDDQKIVVTQDEKGEIQKATLTLSVPMTRVYGRVIGTNHPNGVGLAQVRVSGSGEFAFTDVSGAYSLSRIEWGKRKLKVTAGGYMPKTVEVNLAGPGALFERDVDLDAVFRGDASSAAAASGQKQQKKSPGDRHG